MQIEEKRQALELVLQSRAFRRCDQLKKMLCFVCEAEIEGRAAELNEHLIGVEAFGRPASYSPVEDSTVRTRAYELRNKLTRFYATEAPDAPVRIEIDRGAYVPRFIRRESLPETVPDAPPAASVAAVAAVAPAPVPGWRRPIIALAAFLVMAVGLYGVILRPRTNAVPVSDWTPELEAFWKPFLSNDTPLIFTYQSRLFLLAPPLELMVRNWRTNDIHDVPNSPALQEFQKQMGVSEFVETRNYVDFGAVNSVFLLMRTVGRRQNQILLKRSENLDWTDIFNDNIIFIAGLASASPRLKKLLDAGDFVETVGGVRNVHPKPGELAVYPGSRMTVNGANDGEKYAVLSRFPGPRRGRYIMMLGSAHAELPWALAEYVTNPANVRELVQRLRLPSGDLPEAFQVVLKVSLQSQVPVRVRYATHHVVASPEFPYEPPAEKK